MPAGPERTVPELLPVIDTDRVAPGANTAVTDLALSIVTVHVRFGPEQAPLQKLKSDPADGVAVNVTTVPPGKSLVQSVPQEIPAGAEATEPLAVPATLTVNVIGTSKIAVTERLKSMVIVQGLLWPAQAPPQPVKVVPESAAAVSVTDVPFVYTSEQSTPQSMPAGLDVTVPVPSPWRVTLSMAVLVWAIR